MNNVLNDFPLEKVDLSRKIRFKNSKVTWQGVPLIVPYKPICNTFEVAAALPEAFTFISGDYEVEDLYNFYFSGRPNAVFVLDSLTKFTSLMQKLPKGYLQHVLIDRDNINKAAVIMKELRKKYKGITIWYYVHGLYNGMEIENALSLGADVIYTNGTVLENNVHIRECYMAGSKGDFVTLDINEGFVEFKGETDDNLRRVYEGESLPFSENTLRDVYNKGVEDLKLEVYSSGARTIELYSNFGGDLFE